MVVKRTRGTISALRCPACRIEVRVEAGLVVRHPAGATVEPCSLSGMRVFDRVRPAAAESVVRHLHGAMSSGLARLRGYPPDTVFGPWCHQRRAAGWLWEQWRLAGTPSLPGFRLLLGERHAASVKALERGRSAAWGTLHGHIWLSARVSWCVKPGCRPDEEAPDQTQGEDQ